MDKKHNLTPAILDAFEDGIYVMNRDLVVEYMNSAMVAEFGEGVGKKCHQLVNQSEENAPGVLPTRCLPEKRCGGRFTSRCLTRPTT